MRHVKVFSSKHQESMLGAGLVSPLARPIQDPFCKQNVAERHCLMQTYEPSQTRCAISTYTQYILHRIIHSNSLIIHSSDMHRIKKCGVIGK